MENRVLLVNPVWGEALTHRLAHRRSFPSSRVLRYSRNPTGRNSGANVNRTTMQTQSFLRVSAGQDVLRWKKPLFSLSLFLSFSQGMLPQPTSIVHIFAYMRYFALSLRLSSLFSFLSVFRASEPAYAVTFRPTRGSWILWQEFVRWASDRNLPRRTCRRCSDSNIKLTRSLSIPLSGLVYGLAIPTHYCAASISAHFTKELIPSAR